ncbi:MAG: hypothetical protein ABUK01_08285 [Leptospirales bacterium]
MTGREKRILSSIIVGTFITLLLLPSSHATPPDSNDKGSDCDCKESPSRYRHGVTPPHHGDHLFIDFTQKADELDLTKTQVKKFNQLNHKFVDKIKPLQVSVSAELNRLHTILQEPEINLKRIRVVLEKISPFRISILILKIEHRVAAQKLLTDDQREKLSNKR